MSIVVTVVEMVSSLAKVGEYDNYLIEIRHPDGLEDNLTDTLDRNLKEMGSSIGENNVYVKPLEPTVVQDLLQRLDRDIDMYSMPWLLLLDKHPDQFEPGDECLVLEFGNIENPSDVTQALREIRRAMNDERFARRLSVQKRLDHMQDVLSPIVRGAGLVVSTANLF